MNIHLENTGKRFNREWIFRGVNKVFQQGKMYAITGANGSGKSTMLQVISGASLHSEGIISYEKDGAKIPAEKAFSHISFAAPYLDLIEEMTANEFLSFHDQFKKLSMPVKDILASVNLEKASNKQIRYFSSGMKQRLKLAQAFFSKSSVLLLDEPASNLDASGMEVYQKLLAACRDKLIIISSNDPQEYEGCNEVIPVQLYK